MKMIGIIGHFGKGLHLSNGQTVKTQTIYKTLANVYGEKNILTIDTHGGFKFLLRMPFVLFYTMAKCKTIIIMPARKGLCTMSPLLISYNKLFHRSIHYITIGGWLPELLDEKKWLIKLLQKINRIYIETNSIKKKLYAFNLSNTLIMPNFKNLTINKHSEYLINGTLKLCTFSRVSKEKGIEEAISAINAINKRYKKIVFCLDIYGQIEDKEWFKVLMEKQPNYISYKGCIEPNKSPLVIKDYLALLFPTYYPGECFAGTIIDAFSAGLPVLASNWHDNKDIIKNKVTGLIYKAKSVEDLELTLLYVYKNPQAIIAMRKNCLSEALKYRPQEVIKILTSEIEKTKTEKQ